MNDGNQIENFWEKMDLFVIFLENVYRWIVGEKFGKFCRNIIEICM
jgi:hypothetical protein